MGNGALQEFPHSSGSYARHHGKGRVETRLSGAIPNARMRLLHFENIFGDTYASDYCLAAMSSLVLIMARSAGPDADRLDRLAGTADAAPVRLAG